MPRRAERGADRREGRRPRRSRRPRSGAAARASRRRPRSTPPPCVSMLSRARAWMRPTSSGSRPTATTGASRRPRFTIAWSAGKIFLKARSPVAPKITSASEGARSRQSPFAFSRWPPNSARSAESRRFPNSSGAARAEALVERRGQHVRRHAGLHRGLDRPAPLAGIRDAALEARELRVLAQRARREVEQPGADHAAAPPQLGDLGQVERVLEVLGMRERRRLGVVALRAPARVGVAQEVEALGVGRHQPVLDAVVHHLDEVPRAVGSAVEEAALAAARRAVASRVYGAPHPRRAPASRRSARAAARSPPRRRSSGSSRARAPTRRRSCRRPRSGARARAASRARTRSSW